MDDKLIEFGFKENIEPIQTLKDNLGRYIFKFDIKINSKGHYVISATIEGKVRRRFICQNHPLYGELNHHDIFNLSDHYRINLIEQLFPKKS